MLSVGDLPTVQLSQIEFHAADLDVERAKKAYDEVGFFVVRGLLRNHMERMLEEIERAVTLAHDELAELAESAEQARYGWLTKSGAVFTERTVDIQSPPGRRQLIVAPISQESSEVMRACSRDPKLVKIVEALLQGEISPIGTGQCMYKEARGTAMGLHQDGVYTRIEGYNDVATTYTYVVPTSIERGAIWLIPYSHRLELLPHDESGMYEGCVRADLCSWDNAIALPGEPGDTFFWQWKTIHGSQPNLTDEPRPTLVARYGLPAEAKLLAEKGLGQW